MKLGILSDTHRDRMNAIPYIIKKFKENKVDLIIHCGDIQEEHMKPKLFGDIPVVCALTDEQVEACAQEDCNKEIPFCNPPVGWTLTHPNERIVDLGPQKNGGKAYVGHKRSFEILMGSEEKLMKTLYLIRKKNDSVRYLFSGHTHHQIFMESGLIHFINPGAVEDAMGIAGGYEYAIIDTKKGKTIYSRIPASVSTAPTLKVAVISDSLYISEKDKNFWKKLADVFVEEKVSHIIHCGNISLDDIGRAELENFKVRYALRKDQFFDKKCENWEQIDKEERIVDINGYRFYVQWDLSPELIGKSEMGMHMLALKIQKKHPEIRFILSGFTHNAFYEESENLIFLNPGAVIQRRRYAIIELPLYKITFGKILNNSLPNLWNGRF